MLTYVGRGYTPGFTVNYDRVAERLNLGEEIEIVEGPDDICAPLLDDPDAHCTASSVVSRDDAAIHAVSSLLGEELSIGSHIALEPVLLSALRTGFFHGSIRAACTGCEWFKLCDTVALSGYCGVKIGAAAALQVTS